MAKKNNRASEKTAATKKSAASKTTAAKKAPAKKAAAVKQPSTANPSAASEAASKPTAMRPSPSQTSESRATASRPSTQATSARAGGSEPAPATTISAKVDIGFGNVLYIRGEGPGLSWNKGVPMDCVAADEWIWRTRSASGAFACKVLINDEIWSTGDDFRVPAGERLVCYPSF